MTQVPLKTVDHVDLNRYLGKWYEIARLPNRFEKKCQRDITAEYSRDGKKIIVHNSCIQQDGRLNVAEGRAKVFDPTTNAKLKVTFFWPFYGDYWIIGLDPEYRWAIVGEPDRKYMWVLSRTPHIADVERTYILNLVQQAGYNPGQLIYPQQTGAR
jgi:apolipoprotein D and lipocalin family protein